MNRFIPLLFGAAVALAPPSWVEGKTMEDLPVPARAAMSAAVGADRAELFASDGAGGDDFGYSIAMDGDTIAVGAPSDSHNGQRSGSVYVFQKPAGGWTETQTEAAKLVPSDGEMDDFFGKSIAVAGDTIAVGATYDDDNGTDSGSAYVFVKPTGGWEGTLNESAKLVVSDGAMNDKFGQSIAVAGDTIAVGAVYDDDNGTDSGSAYVFVRPTDGWDGTLNESAKLVASDSFFSDEFGKSIAVADEAVVVGAWFNEGAEYSSGSAYVFVKPTGGWNGLLNEDAKLIASEGDVEDGFGYSIAADGDIVVVGTHIQSTKTGPGPPDSAYVFEKPTGGWAGTRNESAKLIASDGGGYARFGVSISVAGDIVVVGANSYTHFPVGDTSAYVFQKPTDGWNGTIEESAKVVHPEGEQFSQFGHSVTTNGETVAIGAYLGSGNGFGSGSVYLFPRTPQPADTDGDGISDDWETANGLDPGDPDDAALDADGDGRDNRTEFEDGTDPNDPCDCMVLGDVNGDGLRDLGDALLILQMMAGTAPAPRPCDCFATADATGDGRAGIEDALFILQGVAGNRP